MYVYNHADHVTQCAAIAVRELTMTMNMSH